MGQKKQVICQKLHSDDFRYDKIEHDVSMKENFDDDMWVDHSDVTASARK